MSAITERPLPLTTADGTALAASLWAAEAPRACLLINPAMGVPRRYYAAFASWLAARGVAVLVYDYRGLHGSAPARLRGFQADIQTWAEQDQRAAFEQLEQRYPGRPVFVLGHSVGGQVIGLSAHNARARGLVMVASQSGYWGHWSGLMRPGVWLLWHLIIPLLTPLLGRFPAHWFGLGAPLPAGVARQWARWGRHPDYLRGPHPDTRCHHARITAPIRAWVVDDDPLAPPRAAHAMLAWYRPQQVEVVPVRAAEHGGRFGHWAWFREERGEPCWRELLTWMLDRADG